MMIISKFNQSINFSQKMKVEPRITESRQSLILTRVLLVKFTDNFILEETMILEFCPAQITTRFTHL